MRAFSACFVVSLLLSSSSVAFAQDALAHEAQGEALFEAGNYDAALSEFQAAYGQLEGNPGRYLLLWNIGQSYERLFQYDRALDYYQRYLDEGGPDAEDRASVEATMRALEGLLASLTVQSNVADSEIWVDGHQVGRTPGTVRVTSGSHHVEVRHVGYANELREAELSVRQTLRIEVELHAVSDFQGLEPWIFWASTGVAAAALVAGGSVGVAALVDHASTTAIDPMARTQEDRDRIAGLALAADVLYGVAGLFATTSLVLAFVTDWDGAPSADASPGPAATLRIAPIASETCVGLAAWGSF